MAVEVFARHDGSDLLVGRLYAHRGRGVESATFSYDPGWLGDARAYALEPQLPLSAAPAQTRAGHSIFGCFSDSAPDRWGRNLIRRADARRARAAGETPRSMAEIDYLLGVRDDTRQGALRFRPEGREGFAAADDDGIPHLLELPRLLSAAADHERDEDDDETLGLLLRAGSSLGGARPKAHLAERGGRLAIAKFPSVHDDWDVMAWEAVALELAARAGVRTPAARLMEVAGRNILVVERFDRVDSERIGYVSAMTMLDAGDGDQRSYLELAEVIEETSAAPTRDLHELWRRIAVSILISNTDDHLRNHGFLRSEAGWDLSPAFDLNPNPDPGPKHLALAIDYDDPAARVALLLEVTDAFRLTATAASAVLEEVERSVSAWPRVAAALGVPEAQIDAMSSAFEHPEREAARAAAAR